MFHYYRSPGALSHRAPPRTAFVATIPAGITAAHSLLKAVGEALAFPPYYGANFDALWDCLRTLETIAARRVFLVHEDLPSLPRESLETYVEIVRDAGAFWQKNRDRHVFEVWFPVAERRTIEQLLETLPPSTDE